jgi:hypothetical protein
MKQRSKLRAGKRQGISNPFAGLVVGPLMMIFGIVLLVIGWGWYSRTAEWTAAGGMATGTVVEMRQDERTTDNGTTMMYQPVIEFTTQTGETVTYADPTSSSSPRYQIGDKVEIIYNKNFPTDARENTFLSLHLPDTIVMGAGGLFLLLGLFAGLRSLMFVLAAGGIAAYLLAKKKNEEN